nr:MAG TPA: hypothetical protein [Caudoviricetes sp.]DAM68305.1 MAG TPA: hypothetical protein [Caudoviricetes sp.]
MATVRKFYMQLLLHVLLELTGPDGFATDKRLQLLCRKKQQLSQYCRSSFRYRQLSYALQTKFY